MMECFCIIEKIYGVTWPRKSVNREEWKRLGEGICPAVECYADIDDDDDYRYPKLLLDLYPNLPLAVCCGKVGSLTWILVGIVSKFDVGCMFESCRLIDLLFCWHYIQT